MVTCRADELFPTTASCPQEPFVASVLQRLVSEWSRRTARVLTESSSARTVNRLMRRLRPQLATYRPLGCDLHGSAAYRTDVTNRTATTDFGSTLAGRVKLHAKKRSGQESRHLLSGHSLGWAVGRRSAASSNIQFLHPLDVAAEAIARRHIDEW